jgi:Bacterial protein of unknown function (DUF937)
MNMPSLYEILNNAHDGEGMTAFGREFGLTPTQTEAAVTALLPAISTGLKQSTATVDGLGNLFGMMGQQQDLQDMYHDPEAAFGPEGVAAGKDALSVIFGSPDVSRAVIDQAQNFSGVSSNILKKMLPVLAGVLLSGLMRSGASGKTASPAAPAPSGGSLGDILGQIFGRGMPGLPGAPANRGQQFPPPASQAPSLPTEAGGQPTPEGDILGSILRELEKGIREGRIKPVIIGGGPVQIPMPGGQQSPTPSGPGAPATPGGDIFGQILRDILGGVVGGPGQMPQGRQGQSPRTKDLSDLSKQLGVMGGAGAAVFGDHLEAGQDVEQKHIDNIQNVFDRFFGVQGR